MGNTLNPLPGGRFTTVEISESGYLDIWLSDLCACMCLLAVCRRRTTRHFNESSSRRMPSRHVIYVKLFKFELSAGNDAVNAIPNLRSPTFLSPVARTCSKHGIILPSPAPVPVWTTLVKKNITC